MRRLALALLSTAAAAPSGRQLSETVGTDGTIASLRWLPPLENEIDSDADPGARIDDGTLMPVFPVRGALFMPYAHVNLTMTEPRYRRMYEEIIFTGARRFAVVLQNVSDGRLLDVGISFHLANVLTNANGTKLVGECIATGRVHLQRILNPSVYVSPDIELQNFGQGARGKLVDTPDGYLLAQAATVVDVDVEDGEAEAKMGEELGELLLSVSEAQKTLGDVPRFKFERTPPPDAGEEYSQVCFFSHSTHFSHMSEPILPISHL